MKPLRGFVATLKDHCVTDALRREFQDLHLILEVEESIPHDVEGAICAVRRSCGSGEGALLPTLEGLAQGKKLLDLSDTALQQRNVLCGYLNEVAELREQISELAELQYSKEKVDKFNSVIAIAGRIEETIPEAQQHMLKDQTGQGSYESSSHMYVCSGGLGPA